MHLPEFVQGLLRSRKFWLTVGAAVVALLNGTPEYIPAIVMVEIGAITVEDAAHKLGLSWPLPPEHQSPQPDGGPDAGQ